MDSWQRESSRWWLIILSVELLPLLVFFLYQAIFEVNFPLWVGVLTASLWLPVMLAYGVRNWWRKKGKSRGDG